MFRLPYPHALGEFIPAQVRQGDPGMPDLAEAIFGTTDRKPAIKGRVFFEDAPWDGSGASPFLQAGDSGRRTPYVLGSPRPTPFQRYPWHPLVDLPDGEKQPAGNAPRPLGTYPPPLAPEPHELDDSRGNTAARTGGTVIRGHKRYWHQPKATDRERFDRG